MEKTQTNSGSFQQMSPLDSAGRLSQIDSLRGFAMLGILIVNMLAFQYGTIGFKFIYPYLNTPDQSAHIFTEWLFQGSFYPVFSILFGFGAVMIWERSQAKQRPFNLLYFRRMLLLMAIGTIHLYFIWDGDILLTYSITGLVFFLFVKRKAKTLIVWALILAGLMALPGLFTEEEGGAPSGLESYTAHEQQVLSEGSYSEVVLHRLTANPYEAMDFGPDISQEEQELIAGFMAGTSLIAVSIQTLFLFLIGGFIAKKKWLHNPAANKRGLLKAAYIGIIAGLLLKAGMVFTNSGVLDYLGYIIGGPVLGIGYIAAFNLLFLKFGNKSVFRGFAYVGQMALTNYLTQSIVMTTVFYGYGLGLFASIGTFIGIILAVILFTAQILISRWWLGRFKFGPVEWLWRTGTYMKRQPFKK